MRDRDVRSALDASVRTEHFGDQDTLILHELGLRHGSCRVDVAVVNGEMHGYEIKSDADTLDRLEGQVALYSAVLDRATLVVGRKHAEKAVAMLPEWWGIQIAEPDSAGSVAFTPLRSATRNSSIDSVALAELLWHAEAAALLRARGEPEALLRKPRAVLYRRLAETVPVDELRGLIRQQLKARAGWRGQIPLS